MSVEVEVTSNAAVAGLVGRFLENRSIVAKLMPDSDLRDLGLTSLDMVALVLWVEAEFKLTIPETQITPTNFRSVTSINALVTSLRG